MTDEEMTDEEMTCKAICDSIPCKTMCTKCKCYIAGLKAGRETEREYVKNNAFTSMKEQGLFPFAKWHKVADGDLPKHENYVLVSNGKDWTKAFYKDGKWNIISLVGFFHVIAWCEPKFKE